MKRFFAEVADFFRNEPNLKALFGKKQPARGKRRASNAFFFLFYPLATLYLEVALHLMLYRDLPIRTLFFLILFAFAFGFLMSGIALLLPLWGNRLFTAASFTVVTLLFEAQLVHYQFSSAFFRVVTILMAGDALGDFGGETLAVMAECWYLMLLLALPLILLLCNLRRYAPLFAPTFVFRIYLLLLAAILHWTAVGIAFTDRSDFGDWHYYYTGEYSPTDVTRRFGLLTSTRQDLRVTVFGEASVVDDAPLGEVDNPFADETEEPLTLATTSPDEIPPEILPPEPIVYGDNVMDIDFDTLIANETNEKIRGAHEYFASVTPTKKNEYTGMFAGKNLIFLTLEGFSYKTIDAERTPTLYKMANEGFVFNNFYTGLWGGSTATGEYLATTGLFYSSAKCLEYSADNLMPFTMGNQFAKLGYKTYAFHNHVHTYYKRNESHPNMGYEFIAIGSGLEGLTDYWPRSDHEMAVATLPYYINMEEPWHVYYMTVSGHANYSFIGNNMAKKHRAVVETMEASEGVQAYHACQYEVELMLAEIVAQLEAAGKLEDTVFVMSTDHYPYALSDAELAELYGLPEEGIHKNFDLLRNAFIIWSASMEAPVVIDKPCSSLDIIPTVSNLFGLEYDSRLLIGTDLLSDEVPLVILNQDGDGSAWNWINVYGEYSTLTKTFTPYEGFTATEEEIAAYVKQMNNIVSRKTKYSRMVLDEDYYRYVMQ